MKPATAVLVGAAVAIAGVTLGWLVVTAAQGDPAPMCGPVASGLEGVVAV